MITNPPIVDTRVIDQFFTEEELAIFEEEYQESLKTCGDTPFYRDGVLQNMIHGLNIYETDKETGVVRFEKTLDIITTKIKKEFGDDIIIHGKHILNSYQPYKIHTDGILGDSGIDENNYGAWTIVIPLETCDSHTIIFNEWYVHTKSLTDYINAGAEKKNLIPNEIHKKYLSAEFKPYMDYLSLDVIFPWKKGSLMAASRYKFHSSDNFPVNGLTNKRAIILWTILPLNKSTTN
jgi:hypothetical protein